MKTHATAGEMSEHGHDHIGCCCLVGCDLGPCSGFDDPCTGNPNPTTEAPAPLPTEASEPVTNPNPANRCCWDASATGCSFHGPHTPDEASEDTEALVDALAKVLAKCNHWPEPNDWHHEARAVIASGWTPPADRAAVKAETDALAERLTALSEGVRSRHWAWTPPDQDTVEQYEYCVECGTDWPCAEERDLRAALLDPADGSEG